MGYMENVSACRQIQGGAWGKVKMPVGGAAGDPQKLPKCPLDAQTGGIWGGR